MSHFAIQEKHCPSRSEEPCRTFAAFGYVAPSSGADVSPQRGSGVHPSAPRLRREAEHKPNRSAFRTYSFGVYVVVCRGPNCRARGAMPLRRRLVHLLRGDSSVHTLGYSCFG